MPDNSDCPPAVAQALKALKHHAYITEHLNAEFQLLAKRVGSLNATGERSQQVRRAISELKLLIDGIDLDMLENAAAALDAADSLTERTA